MRKYSGVLVAGAEHNPRIDGEFSSPLFVWQQRFALRDSRFGPAPARPTLDNWGPIVVPTSHFFVLGDNSLISGDARYWHVPINLAWFHGSFDPPQIQRGTFHSSSTGPLRAVLGRLIRTLFPVALT